MRTRTYSIKARKLRIGDQIQAADGVTWLDPIRGVQANAKRYGVVEVWIQRALFNAADHEFYGTQTLRVRRQVGVCADLAGES